MDADSSDDIILIDITSEEEENENKEEEINTPTTSSNEEQPFIDLKGNVWNYLGPGGFVERHYPLLGLQLCTETKRWAVLFCSQRYNLKCPYQMLLIKKKGLIYQRFEHSHEVTKTPEELLKGKTPSPRKDGEDGRMSHELELNGWKLITKGVHNEDDLKEHIRQNHVAKLRSPNDLISYFKCKYPGCSYRMRWFKRLGEIWGFRSHIRRHPTKRKKGRRLILKDSVSEAVVD